MTDKTTAGWTHCPHCSASVYGVIIPPPTDASMRKGEDDGLVPVRSVGFWDRSGGCSHNDDSSPVAPQASPGEEWVVWSEPLCLKPGFVSGGVMRAKKADVITAQKGNFPERNYTDEEALDEFMVVHWAWLEPIPSPAAQEGEYEWDCINPDGMAGRETGIRQNTSAPETDAVARSSERVGCCPTIHAQPTPSPCKASLGISDDVEELCGRLQAKAKEHWAREVYDAAPLLDEAAIKLRALSARVGELKGSVRNVTRGFIDRNSELIAAQAEIKKLKNENHMGAAQLLAAQAEIKSLMDENNAYRKAINPRAEE